MSRQAPFIFVAKQGYIKINKSTKGFALIHTAFILNRTNSKFIVVWQNDMEMRGVYSS